MSPFTCFQAVSIARYRSAASSVRSPGTLLWEAEMMKLALGRRRQGDDVEAGLVEGLHHGHQLGSPVAGAGAGDQKDQRRLLLLVGEGAAQPLVVKENRRFLPVRDDIEHELPGAHLCGKFGHKVCRSPEDGGFIRSRDRVAVAVICRKTCHGQQDEAGDEQQSQVHHADASSSATCRLPGRNVRRAASVINILPVAPERNCPSGSE